LNNRRVPGWLLGLSGLVGLLLLWWLGVKVWGEWGRPGGALFAGRHL